MDSSYFDEIMAEHEDERACSSRLSPTLQSTFYHAAMVLGLQEEHANSVARRGSICLMSRSIQLVEPCTTLDIPACGLAIMTCLTELNANSGRTLRAAMKCNLHTMLRCGASLALNSSDLLVLAMPLDTACFDSHALAAALLRFSSMAKGVVEEIERHCEV